MKKKQMQNVFVGRHMFLINLSGLHEKENTRRFKWERKSNFQMLPILHPDSCGVNCLQGKGLFNICMFNAFEGYIASVLLYTDYQKVNIRFQNIWWFFKHLIYLFIYVFGVAGQVNHNHSLLGSENASDHSHWILSMSLSFTLSMWT